MDDIMSIPIYSQSEVASILGAPQSSLQRWASGYRTTHGTLMPPIITAESGRGFKVPFVGLAEAFIVRAFTRAGVPLPRIRETVEVLRKEIGLENALASERLQTDGAEILMNFTDGDTRLVVVRNKQAAFGEIVNAHLKQIDYFDGFVGQVHFPDRKIFVDPRVNFGQPTVKDIGVRVSDIVDRARAGEDSASLAQDFGMPVQSVQELLLTAS